MLKSKNKNSGKENLVKEVVTEYVPNLGKDMEIHVLEAYKIPNRYIQKNKSSPWHITMPKVKKKLF
jgi:hypothetical protein